MNYLVESSPMVGLTLPLIGDITFSWDSNWNQPKITYDIPTDYELDRGSLSSNADSLTYFMEFEWEKWLIAIPQLYGWFYLQKYGGLTQFCWLQEADFDSSSDRTSQECWEYAYLFKSLYLVMISTFLASQPVLWSLWYNNKKETE